MDWELYLNLLSFIEKDKIMIEIVVLAACLVLSITCYDRIKDIMDKMFK